MIGLSSAERMLSLRVSGPVAEAAAGSWRISPSVER